MSSNETYLLGQAPIRVAASLFASLPVQHRKARATAWSMANVGGQELECFLEGPVVTRGGDLLLTDIPNGRVFRVDAAGEWSLVVEYDGWPNGLKIDTQGLVHIADYKRGILTLDLRRGVVETKLEHYRSERFKGVNDLYFARNGDLYFTDQGQTGWQDPTGRVFRFSMDGELSCLADFLPSPNGLTLNLAQTQLFVAITRANAVWRLPILPDGGTSKVGTYLQMSGGAAGPDGLALDSEGGLIVAHPGTTVWRFDRCGLPTHVVEVAHDAFFTNITFGIGSGANDIFITDSIRGEIWRARMPAPAMPTH